MSSSDPLPGTETAAAASDVPAPKPRRPRRGRKRSAAEVASLIAREWAELPADDAPEGTGAVGAPQAAGREMKLQRLMRVLWELAEGGDVKAARCVLEYLEGKPAQTVTVRHDEVGDRVPSADEMARLLADGVAKVTRWQAETAD